MEMHGNLKKLKRDGVILGLSGGIDSAGLINIQAKKRGHLIFQRLCSVLTLDCLVLSLKDPLLIIGIPYVKLDLILLAIEKRLVGSGYRTCSF